MRFLGAGAERNIIKQERAKHRFDLYAICVVIFATLSIGTLIDKKLRMDVVSAIKSTHISPHILVPPCKASKMLGKSPNS